MLLELRVENYAVIDQVAVEFAPGLNLLTGETGAGKSILIDALALLLGEKASSEVIRHGAEKAVVAAVFRVEGAQAAAILEANGLDEEAGEIILRREIAAGGKGRVFINNQPATVNVLRQLAPELASIHAQNETLMAFDASARLALLDTYAGTAVGPASAAFEKWRSIRRHIEELERDEQDRLRLVDLWSFQKKEIEDARPEAGEDERLEAEKRVLADAEKVRAAALHAYTHLYDGESAAAASLRAAIRRVQELAGYDEKTFREDLAALESARIAAEDSAGKLREFAERIQASPERLAQVEDRLALLDRLKRKYGQTLEAVIAYGAEVTRKLNEVENRDEVLRRLRAELAAAAGEYLRAARALSRQRAEAARKLEKLAEDEINDLAMKARFRIELSGGEEEGNWTAAGFDQVRYLISTNPGDPLRAVEQIASGGELSRVMLSLKACVESGGVEPGGRARRTSRPAAPRTLVFDEIDSGIGGRAAEAVGRKLKSLARSQQVLCVTHLPQIASFADQHYRIDKKEAGGRTRTSISRLDERERTQEVARMLSGARLTETSLKHAEQLLKTNA
ncbi:MAG TPA: DNA repair protein RecN [Terriglobales bacterium]|nr:DNA repair protein RecN [Terriglobales bacterium]